MRAAFLIGSCVALVALVFGFTAFTRSPEKSPQPSLRLVQSSPVKVRGDHFRPLENVRVLSGHSTVRARANGSGIFVVTLPAGRCGATRVLAQGSAGSYVVLKLLPPPACLPARTG